MLTIIIILLLLLYYTMILYKKNNVNNWINVVWAPTYIQIQHFICLLNYEHLRYETLK